MFPEELFDFCERCGGVDVADNHQDGVARRVPFVIELLEHRAGRRVEGVLRAKRIVGIRSTREHILYSDGQ